MYIWYYMLWTQQHAPHIICQGGDIVTRSDGSLHYKVMIEKGWAPPARPTKGEDHQGHSLEHGTSHARGYYHSNYYLDGEREMLPMPIYPHYYIHSAADAARLEWCPNDAMVEIHLATTKYLQL